MSYQTLIILYVGVFALLKGCWFQEVLEKFAEKNCVYDLGKYAEKQNRSGAMMTFLPNFHSRQYSEELKFLLAREQPERQHCQKSKQVFPYH